MVVVLDFSLRRMLVRLDWANSSRCTMRTHMSMLPIMNAVLCRCRWGGQPPEAVQRQLEQIFRWVCTGRRPHAPLTSARPRAHRSDARSPGRSRSSAVFAVIALWHVHLLQRFDACADRRGSAAWGCMYQIPGLSAWSLYLMHGGSAACICCTHACTLVAALVSPHAGVGMSFCDLNIVCVSWYDVVLCMHL